MRGKSLRITVVANTYCSYKVPLKGTRHGGPGLGTHACKTRWHEGGLVGEQGYEAEAANVSSLFHLNGHSILVVCTSLIAHHENWEKERREKRFHLASVGLQRHIPLTFGVLPRCHVGSSDWPWPESYAVTLFTTCAFECYHTPKLPASFCFCLGSKDLDWWNMHLQD